MKIVLLGFIGSGKTFLYNKITGQKLNARDSNNQQTRSVSCKEAACGKEKFTVFDTPGFGCQKYKIQHAAGVIAALTQVPINKILLVVKFARIEEMRKTVKTLLGPINRFRPLITLTITHWECCENQEHMQQLIKTTFQKLNINSFIFTTKEEKQIIIFDKILNELLNTSAVKIEFMNSEIMTQFDLIEFRDEQELAIQFSKGQILQKFYKDMCGIKKQIEDAQPPEQQKIDHELLAEKSLMLLNNSFFSKQTPYITQSEQAFCETLHSLTIESKKIAQICLKEFEYENQNEINLMIEKNGSQYGFLLHTLLKKELSLRLDGIVELAQEKFLQIKGHCFNQIKKCNYCGQIWMKVQGCQGKTYCGAMPNQDELLNGNQTIIPQVMWASQPEFEDDNSSRNQTPLILSSNNSILIQKGKCLKLEDKNELYEIGEKGCGKLIQWHKMELLSKGELRELIDPGMLDFLCLWDIEITYKAKEYEFLDLLDQQIALQAQQIKHQ